MVLNGQWRRRRSGAGAGGRSGRGEAPSTFWALPGKGSRWLKGGAGLTWSRGVTPSALALSQPLNDAGSFSIYNAAKASCFRDVGKWERETDLSHDVLQHSRLAYPAIFGSLQG